MNSQITPLFDAEIAEAAILAAIPTIERLSPSISWGPKGAMIGLIGPGMEEPVLYNMGGLTVGEDIARFTRIVKGKIKTTLRDGVSSGHMNTEDPAGLSTSDVIHQGGYQDGSLVAALSGYHGWADEYGARIVLICAQTLCRAIVNYVAENRDQADMPEGMKVDFYHDYPALLSAAKQNILHPEE